MYKVKVNDVDELFQHIQTVWDELDQRIVDKAIKHAHPPKRLGRMWPL